MSNDIDHLRPIHDAADTVTASIGDAFGADQAQRIELRHELIEFAGAILDAVRHEALAEMRRSNEQAIRDELAQTLR